MTQTYRVAMIGCGGRAREHAPALKADARAHIVALADIKRDRAEALNTDFGLGATVYTDYREMLEKERPDVVVSCLWTGLHWPVFRDCVEANVRAVLSEKPMAPTYGESLDMARLAESAGVMLTFCHQRRFAPGNILARKLIADGSLGTVQRMELYSPPHLVDCGTHTFDQAFSFLGETPVKWVLGAADVSETINYFGLRAETTFVGTLVYENGVRATIQTGKVDMDMGSGIRVTGTDGFIEVLWDGEWKRAVRYADPHWTPPPTDNPPGVQMQGIVSNALDCLETGGEPELSHRKALRAAEVIFAFYESLRRHARVELPLTGVTDNPFLSMLDAGKFAQDY